MSTTSPELSVGQRWKHTKSGTVYFIVTTTLKLKTNGVWEHGVGYGKWEGEDPTLFVRTTADFLRSFTFLKH